MSGSPRKQIAFGFCASSMRNTAGSSVTSRASSVLVRPEPQLEKIQNGDRCCSLSRGIGLDLFHQLEANSSSEFIRRTTSATSLPAEIIPTPGTRPRRSGQASHTEVRVLRFHPSHSSDPSEGTA